MTPPSDWIAPTGMRRFEPDAIATDLPDAVMADPQLSLMAKGLYALVLTYQGRPVDPYQGAIEDVTEIRTAIDKLIAGGYVVRVER